MGLWNCGLISMLKKYFGWLLLFCFCYLFSFSCQRNNEICFTSTVWTCISVFCQTLLEWAQVLKKCLKDFKRHFKLLNHLNDMAQEFQIFSCPTKLNLLLNLVSFRSHSMKHNQGTHDKYWPLPSVDIILFAIRPIAVINIARYPC